MTETKPRLALPRKAMVETTGPRPMVVTPDYGAEPLRPVTPSPTTREGAAEHTVGPARRTMPARQRDPFEGFGDRLSSRPLALRLPRPIDLAIRQIAAERQVQPLRLIDQAVREFLEKLGRLPDPPGA
ncbi:MAG: hypothetical protein GY873_22490 [Bosea sp.]|uniref:hypothetical protein n=1 Tax=Hyphomicrobiales TaxID=356 RepID=UPI000832F168|nr:MULTISPECIES: hypothetical protein [Hyphomicrobiales]MCP4561769.1 hypothetical protein [Bosea sp. (in: a-proteobacteria)]MCP4736960.1 hypothetical protein [Bosea sp. (in: a-proteobacteria)]MDX3805960.1 hypothetical protein [Bosea sp. (in: a-proteobacteria)]